jgi:cobalt-zinc-cadmium efflux system protein
MHAILKPEDSPDAVLQQIRERLKTRHGIGHVTIEVTKGS